MHVSPHESPLTTLLCLVIVTAFLLHDSAETHLCCKVKDDLIALLQQLTIICAFTGMPNTYAETLTISNYVFTGLFTMEMLLKLFALGFLEYAADSFNLFDGLVVILSIVEIILDVSAILHDLLHNPS